MFARHSLVSILDLGPIDACIQLSAQLPLMTVQELHVELPYVLRRIFGFGRFDWSLRDIGNDRARIYFQFFKNFSHHGMVNYGKLYFVYKIIHHNLHFNLV